MKLKSIINRLIFVLMSILFAAALSVYSYPYWGYVFNKTQGELEVVVDDFSFDFDNPIDKLPSSVPAYIIERLEQIALSADSKEVELLAEAVARIVDYPPFQEQINVVVAVDANGLFNDYMQPLKGGDFLIFLTLIDGQYEINFVHISDNSPIYNSAQQLELALSQPWTGYNQISNVWLRGNLYDTFNSPLEYENRAYLMNYNGPSGVAPVEDRGTWFEIPLNYEYNPLNTRYYQNYIVEHEGVFYIASQPAWANVPTQTGWSPWAVIAGWTSNVNYMPNSVVMTNDNGNLRFFRALMSANDIEPNENSAKAGVWQEINNGWIGRNGDTDIKSYYFDHNTYRLGDVVIYGVSPKMKYSYYAAIGDVPSGEYPLIRGQDGIVRLNSRYWEVYYDTL